MFFLQNIQLERNHLKVFCLTLQIIFYISTDYKIYDNNNQKKDSSFDTNLHP